MYGMCRVLLGLLGVAPATAKTLSMWLNREACSGSPSSTMNFPEGEFCGGLGQCWITKEADTNLRYMKWYAHQNKLFAVFWAESGGACGTVDDSTYVDAYSEPESQKLWTGQCAKGTYNRGASVLAVKLDAPCTATGTCTTCLKKGIANKVKQDCKAGAKEAVKKVLQDNVGVIGSSISQALVGELDSESLQELAGQTVADACQTCLEAIVNWLMEESPTTCSGGESCSGVDYMAGFAMQYMGISGKCSAAATSGGASGEGGETSGGASGEGGAVPAPTPSPGATSLETSNSPLAVPGLLASLMAVGANLGGSGL